MMMTMQHHPKTGMFEGTNITKADEEEACVGIMTRCKTSGSTTTKRSSVKNENNHDDLLLAISHQEFVSLMEGFREELKEDISKEKGKNQGRERKTRIMMTSVVMILFVFCFGLINSSIFQQQGKVDYGTVTTTTAVNRSDRPEKQQQHRLLGGVSVDETGHLVDSSTGEVVVTVHEATLIEVVPNSELVQKRLAQHMRRLTGGIIGEESEDESLEEDGLQLLGYVGKWDVENAYHKYVNYAEAVNIQFKVAGMTFTKAGNADGLVKASWSSADGGRRRRHRKRNLLTEQGYDLHDTSIGQNNSSDSGHSSGEEGAFWENFDLYSGMYLKEDPTTFFRVECPNDENEHTCMVLSEGRFVSAEEGRDHQGHRRLNVWPVEECTEGIQCEDAEDGQKCLAESIGGGEYGGGRTGCYRKCSDNSHCPTTEGIHEGSSQTNQCTHTVNSLGGIGGMKYCGATTNLWGKQCFSGYATVQVQGKGTVAMADLNVGDKVLTSSQQYEAIYAFGHYHKTQAAVFLQIHTDNNRRPIEMTGEHMVFVFGKRNPVRADSIQVGDALQSAKSNSGSNTVTKISIVKREGLFAPLTPGGTVIVDGIKASSYVSLQDQEEYVELQHGVKPMSQQDFIHLVLTPFRMICSSNVVEAPDFCRDYDDNGMPHFIANGIQFLKWLDGLDMNIILQILFFSLAFVIFGVLIVAEFAMDHAGPLLALSSIAMIITASFFNKTILAKVSEAKKID